MNTLHWMSALMLSISTLLFLDTMICVARRAVGSSLVRILAAGYFLYVAYTIHVP